MSKHQAIDIFQSAISAVQPLRLLKDNLTVDSQILLIVDKKVLRNSVRNIYIIGSGKASAAMAVTTEEILGAYITDGLVTTKYGHAIPSSRIKIIEAAHPVPDENCVGAVRQTLQLLNKVTKDDIVICLLSGGASALWCDVPLGATLHDVQQVFELLINSGAAIEEINTVRKHLSGIKGGQLIKHCNGAAVFSLAISDVPTDDLSIIASGPTVPDPSTFSDAHTVLLKYDLLKKLSTGIVQHIENGVNGAIAETPKPGDALFDNTSNKIIGNNKIAILAAARHAKTLGYHVHVIDQLITGDAIEEAKKLVNLAQTYKGDKPVCIIQGGETTVKVTGKGKGGRNQHFTLAALHELSEDPSEDITILSGGTDGTDGPTDAAGAVIDWETLQALGELKLSIDEYLQNHDAYHFFKQTGDLLITGPTQTNVMDIMIAIVK
jgi:glycerate 2-kinase